MFTIMFRPGEVFENTGSGFSFDEGKDYNASAAILDKVPADYLFDLVVSSFDQYIRLDFAD